jgi:hypothetical protein
MTAVTPPVKKACDACHRRKVRCSGGEPCKNCAQTKLNCTYLAIPQKKGPKGSRAKVISEIRDTQIHLQQQLPQTEGTQQISSQGPTTALTTPTLLRGQSSPFDFNGPLTPTYSRTPGLLSQQTIDACLAFFFEHLYPTMPIFHQQQLTALIYSPDASQSDAYCLVASLCAFVMVQPGMNLNVSGAVGESYAGEPPQNRYGFANLLLEDLIRVRHGSDYVERPTLATAQTSFFMFCSYFTLEKQNSCWYYLREASTLVQLMKMHEESTYYQGDAEEKEFRRRTFWLILLSERAYAMERHRTLSVHPTIEFPQMAGPEAEVMQGFVYLTKLFCCIDDDFMALWNKTKSECSPEWLSRLQQRLCEVLPPDLQATDHQVADLRITQQWLRIMVWQLSVAHGHISSHSQDPALRFLYPIEVVKDLIGDIKGLSLASMEVHGVGLIEKLFDVACTLIDVITCVPLDASNTEPKENLAYILQLVSKLRGGASRYLPLLAARMKEIPSFAPPSQQMPLSIKQGYAGASDHLPTPMMPVTNGGMPQFSNLDMDFRPINRQINANSGIMFDTYSPSTQNSPYLSTSPHMGCTPDGYPTVGPASLPRSVPAVSPYETYPG